MGSRAWLSMKIRTVNYGFWVWDTLPSDYIVYVGLGGSGVPWILQNIYSSKLCIPCGTVRLAF